MNEVFSSSAWLSKFNVCNVLRAKGKPGQPRMHIKGLNSRLNIADDMWSAMLSEYMRN